LKVGTTLQQAQAELNVLAQHLARDHPETNRNMGFNVAPYPTTSVSDSEAHLVELVTTLSALILVIACMNLANLQFVRTTRRLPEFAVRRALGCSRSRLVQMLLAESLLVSVTGGILGIFIAYWGNTVVARFLNYDLPIDGRVVVFSFAASTLTGLLFGAVPAWVASKADAAVAMKVGAQMGTSDRSRRFLRQTLVIVEIGLAATILAGAGFFVAGIYRFMHRDLGWREDHLVVGYLALSHDKYGEENDSRSLMFTDRFREEMAAIPGVTAATVSRLTPIFGYNWEPFTVKGGPPPETGRVPFAEVDSSSPGFFDTFGVKLLSGRDFNETDRPGNPSVVIVNQTLAQKFWPGQNPIGKRIGSPDPRNPNWSEVVGVMQDFRTGIENPPGAAQFQYFRPWAQNTNRFLSFSVRTSGSPGLMKDAIGKMVARLDPDVAPYSLRTAEEALESQVSVLVFVRKVLLLVSALGLLLAVVGLYGVVSNLVAERTREIGIRIALGAQPGRLIWHFLQGGVILTTTGLVIGVGASLELFQLLTKLLPAANGDDPAIIAVVAGLLFAVAIIASWVPSWRAANVNPVQALRAE
jgi:putative ABC transport system permease protein